VGGTGLGLAIVKHIALAHRGTVSVQSAVGVGSTFTLRMPISPPSAAS
jgi:signal transduction histidine kinase